MLRWIRIDHSLDSVLEQRYVEVNQQAQRFMDNSHVGAGLESMLGDERIDRLYFDNKLSSYQQIDLPSTDDDSLINNFDRLLAFEGDATKRQFDVHRSFVHFLLQARPQVSMNFDCRANH